MWRVIRWGWILATVVVLVITLRGFDGGRNPDAEVFLAWMMLLLGFPSSIVFSAAFAMTSVLLATRFGTTISTSYGSIVASWIVLTLLGYAQWFILLPKLVRKVRESRHRST